MIDPVTAMSAAVSELQSLARAATAPTAAKVGADIAPDAASPMSFGAALSAALGRVDGAVAAANGAARQLAAGDHDIPLSDVMISLETANLGLQMAANVRDKVIAAYASIMNMQL